MKKLKEGSVLGGSFIVAGTGIGAGMLAMPVVSAAGGFLPSVLIYVACYLTMIVTGLLVSELVLWEKKESNFLSIAEHFLGKKAQVFTLIIYIFLFYFLLVAYITGSGQILSQFFSYSNPRLFSLIFVLVASAVILHSTKAIDHVNRVFFYGLIITYIGFIVLGIQFAHPKWLLHMHFGKALIALPVIFIAFSYQGTVPTLCHYLGRDVGKIRGAIIGGSTIALGVYLIWQAYILAVIPLEGPFGLKTAQIEGKTALFSLANVVHNPTVFILGQLFAFCAIMTSFLGVSMGVLDFIADGLDIPKRGKALAILGAFTFFPPLVVSLSNPRLFIVALNIAGGVGCVILLGVLPLLMYLSGRYIKQYPSNQLFKFGPKTIGIVFLFLLLVFFMMVIGLFK
jgi:tyrosine-specific transport protein